MLNKKNILYFISLCICMYLLAKRSSGMFEYLYAGVEFHDTMIVYGLHFWSISILGMYIGMECFHYIKSYSSYVMIRNHSRKKVYQNFQMMVIKKVLYFEINKMILFCISIFMIYHKVQIPSILECLQFMTLYIFMEIVLMSILMFIEIFIHYKIASIVVLSYFIVALGMGDVLVKLKIPTHYHLFLLSNISMGLRRQFLSLSSFKIMLLFILIMAVIYIIGLRKMIKKDMI